MWGSDSCYMDSLIQDSFTVDKSVRGSDSC